MDILQYILQNEIGDKNMPRSDQIQDTLLQSAPARWIAECGAGYVMPASMLQTVHLMIHHLDPAQIAQWDDAQRQVVYRQLFLRAVHDAASGTAACSSAAVAEAIANSELYDLTAGYGRRGPRTPPPNACITPPPEESFYATALREAYRLSAARSAFYTAPLKSVMSGAASTSHLGYHQMFAAKDCFQMLPPQETDENFHIIPLEEGFDILSMEKSAKAARSEGCRLPFFGDLGLPLFTGAEGTFEFPVEDDFEMSYSDESFATLSDEEASGSCSPRETNHSVSAEAGGETEQAGAEEPQGQAPAPAQRMSNACDSWPRRTQEPKCRPLHPEPGPGGMPVSV